MKQFAARLWRRLCEVVAAYYQRILDACTSCRDCQNSVAFLEHTCEHCGAYAPVRVPGVQIKGITESGALYGIMLIDEQLEVVRLDDPFSAPQVVDLSLPRSLDAFGQVDVLVNKAGAHYRGPVVDRTPEEILAIDSRATFAEVGLDRHLSPLRSNGLASIDKEIRRRAAEMQAS